METEMKPSKSVVKIVAAILALAAVYWFGVRAGPKVDGLNQALHAKASAALREFPYAFQVERVDGDVAVMGTPRSAEVPVARMIAAIHPGLAGKAPDDPDFVAAEKEIAALQSEARQIVLDQGIVKRVKWELDRNWLVEHNIAID